jgi:hypothetical protein
MSPDDLVTQVRWYSDRTESGLPDAQVFALAEVATGRINTLLRDHPRMYRRGSYTAPANAERIPLPYDALRVRTVERAGEVLPQLMAGTRGTGDCTIPGWIDRGDCLEITVPETTATDYQIGYHRAIPAPVSGGTPNWVLDFFPDVYLYATLVELATSIKDKENGGVWDNLFQDRIGRLVAQGWDQNLGDAPRVRLPR